MREISTSGSLGAVKAAIDELAYGDKHTRETVQGFFDDVVKIPASEVNRYGRADKYLRNALDSSHVKRSRERKVQCGACYRIMG